MKIISVGTTEENNFQGRYEAFNVEVALGASHSTAPRVPDMSLFSPFKPIEAAIIFNIVTILISVTEIVKFS